MLGRLGFGLGLFVGSLAVGWTLGRAGWLTEPRASRVIRVVVKRLSPFVLGLSFWRLQLSGEQLLLPILGGLTALSTLAPAWGYTRIANFEKPQTGSFLTCAMFSNVGYLGAFVAFALHGEVAYSLAMVQLLYFNPCFYLVGFTLAKRYGHATQAASSIVWFSDELRLYPLVGLVTGLVLSLAKVPRPAICEPINHVLIPVDTALYLMAIGSQLRLESMDRWWQPALAMSAIKFVYTPLIGWILVTACHLEGLPRFVVLLQSAMPVAISPLMLPLLFGLDRRLSSLLWLITTCASVVWLPAYLFLIR